MERSSKTYSRSMDLDHALRIVPPAALTAEKLHIRCYSRAIPDSENAKEYLSSVEEQFKGTSKAHASTLILKMLTTKYDGVSGVCEHLMMMSDMENKLKGMDMEISEEEERLKVKKPDIVHIATTNSNKRKGSWKGKGSSGDNSTSNKVQKPMQVLAHSKAVQNASFAIRKGISKRIIQNSRNAEVENQLDRKIKVVRSDRGGEYYGRHTDVGQAPGSFFDFCKDHGIINQYTMSGTPQQNGVAERRNRTLMDMVRNHPNNVEENEPNPEINVQPQETQQPLRRTQRNRQPTNFDDYYTYLNEADFDLRKCNDPKSFEDAITCDQSAHWREAMKDKLNSMSKNNVWKLAELPKGTKPVGCKWVFKTKNDPIGNVERYKARLVAKGYTQKEGVDYKETFSPVSRKDSLRIVMALVAHFDLELHQMDVKTAFRNGDLHEDVYMAQPQGFKSKGQEHLVCKLKKSIYGLKQASRQWYLKFDEVMKKHNLIKNQVDQCVYLKMNGRNFIILVLYVDDILLASNNIDFLHESKRFLSRNFDMKDLGEALYVIGNEIHRDRANGKLGLSQKAYIERVLNRRLKIYCDNSTAVSFSNSNSSTGAGLYLDKKYLFVRERVEEQPISIEHIRTHEMLADPLTKGLPPKVFQGHVAKMGFRQDLT
ncbi:putative zinc finger, CCHC-type containing protein [Tanacetum coccineum]